MDYDNDELLLLKEAREHPIGHFREVERQPGVIERVSLICQNLAQVALSKIQSPKPSDAIKHCDHLRLG
jgi:hypothetical protein